MLIGSVLAGRERGLLARTAILDQDIGDGLTEGMRSKAIARDHSLSLPLAGTPFTSAGSTRPKFYRLAQQRDFHFSPGDLPGSSSNLDMLEPESPAAAVNLRRGSSLRISSTTSTEEGKPVLRRSGSLRIPRSSDARDAVARGEQTRLTSARSSPSSTSSSSTSSSDRCADCSSSNNRSFRPARRYAPAATSDAPAPEYLARSLLQLGCPVVSMPTPRGGVGSEQLPSSDSDDYSAIHQQHHSGHGQSLDSCAVPKVQVSGPSNADESASIING
ncbi:hypothetical protein HN011_002162, partial [Eciton burchellii]